MSKKVVLFTLQSFSTTGGVQKMARTLTHALYQISEQQQWDFKVWSLYDKKSDLMEQYVPANKFLGFGYNRLSFSTQILAKSHTYDIVILSHINLALVGLIIKLIKPSCKVFMIAHGIEVWRPLTFVKKLLLKKCNGVICVSNFTRDQVIKLHDVEPEKCVVLNNAVDPFIKLPQNFLKPPYLLKRYNLTDADQVIFTLTRMAYTEQYKGYEQVIKAISILKSDYPSIKYILAGKYDEKEEQRVRKLISDFNVTENVILTGFINENELPDYFLLADMFVLPSKKEGFGIVFIEALACGLPVISGNADGSNDAVRNGELGKSINADDLNELKMAMIEYLQTPLTIAKRKELQAGCLQFFNETDYIKKLQAVLFVD